MIKNSEDQKYKNLIQIGDKFQFKKITMDQNFNKNNKSPLNGINY